MSRRHNGPQALLCEFCTTTNRRQKAIPLKRGEYIVVMPVRTESSNSHSGSDGSTSENPNVAMWIAGSKIIGEIGYFPSSFVELIKLEGASPKRVSTLTAQQ